jgi:hypothetical protein
MWRTGKLAVSLLFQTSFPDVSRAPWLSARARRIGTIALTLLARFAEGPATNDLESLLPGRYHVFGAQRKLPDYEKVT